MMLTKEHVFNAAVGAAAFCPVLLIGVGLSEAGWSFLISAVIVMLATRFDTIEEFSLGPLRAKYRRRIEEQEIALREIRKVAVVLSGVAMALVSGSGRFGGTSKIVKKELMEQIQKLLTSLNIPDDEKELAFYTLNKYQKFDLASAIIGNDGNLSQQASDDLRLLIDYQTILVSSPSKFREILKKHDSLDPEREEHIKDFEFFLEHGKLRRQK